MVSELPFPEGRGKLWHLLIGVAREIQACFWFMVPCAGLSFLITVFLVKKISLKRDDDVVKKAEPKAWVESKKAKHRPGKHGDGSDQDHEEAVHADDFAEKRDRLDSQATISVGVGDGADGKNGVDGVVKDEVGKGEVGKVKDELEKEVKDVEREEEEANGVLPSKDEGVEQGPVGSRP